MDFLELEICIIERKRFVRMLLCEIDIKYF